MKGDNGKDGKIHLGKLAVDPVFLAIFAFFTVSAITMVAFMIISSR